MTITDHDFKRACQRHADALFCYGWLFAPNCGRTRIGDDSARRTAERTIIENGWTPEQVCDYATSPERGLPLCWPPKEKRMSRASAAFALSPDDAIRAVMERLQRRVPPPMEPTPERKRALTAELVRSIMPIGSEFRDRDAYEVAERASIMAEEPAEGVRTEFLVSVPDEDPFA